MSAFCVLGSAGQSTVELAVVAAALAAVAVGLGALWRAFDVGVFVEHAVACASHNAGGAIVAAAADVLLY